MRVETTKENPWSLSTSTLIAKTQEIKWRLRENLIELLRYIILTHIKDSQALMSLAPRNMFIKRRHGLQMVAFKDVMEIS